MPGNLHPLTAAALGRTDKERRLHQPGKVIWLYGLSGAGKSTLAVALEHRLAAENYVIQLLDGDSLRLGLNRDLGFGDKDRSENIRRVAEVAKLFAHAGIVTICSFITPFRAHRALAREIISPADLIEVHIAASYAVCAQRDPKGLYAKAAAGNLLGFTGRDSAFEPPTAAETTLILRTETSTPEESLLQLHTHVIAHLERR
ncbi:MAG: adenylyl-sulfate kinase [Undibacterium sp.]|nr:adenylyl-sulfate kinase [Opitutaceae bacterium]